MNRRNFYEKLVRPLLFFLDAETAHHYAIASLRLASALPALQLLSSSRAQSHRRAVFGISFPNPVGLAAGFDKNGVAIPAWEALGFGFAEIGTVTARAQPGNPSPRIFRYPPQRALINRLGFNNDGADVVAERLRRLRTAGRWPGIPIGINIGKTRDTPIEEAAADYCYSFRRLREFADYVVLNVSSPNTPGLRSLQETKQLTQLLGAIARENTEAAKPILVKISPDLSTADLYEVIEICEENGVAGLIATNTTLDHSSIPPALDETGGLSGAPLQERSTELVREITARSRLPVIASGGIFDAETAREKIEAGASLLQVYTGYVYRGPGLIREIVEGLDEKRRAAR